MSDRSSPKEAKHESEGQMSIATIERIAMDKRNMQWRSNPSIPTWVDIDAVPLDQFYTREEVARRCLDGLMSFMRSDGADPEATTFLEPSAGTGAFSNLLPRGRSIALDIMPQTADTIEADFLSWTPAPSDLPVVVVGNPPFGYRAWLALEFMNHAAKFADYVGFILPMAFQSDGKGSPKPRVRGMHLVHSEILERDSFVNGAGKSIKVNALWQIWKRGELEIDPVPTCNQWIELFTVDQRKERLCGQERMSEADFFLQRTFYREAPDLVLDFADVKYVCGYGIVIKKDRARILKALEEANWHEYSNLAAHNCRHISMYHIRRVITDAGFVDQS